MNANVNLSHTILIMASILQYSSECYCDNKVNGGVSYNCYNDRATTCAGNADEACGGPNAVSVYRGNFTQLEHVTMVYTSPYIQVDKQHEFRLHP